MSGYRVLYDACVLYPAPLRDLLVQLASASLFRAHWTEAIHEEWIRNVLKNRPDIVRDTLIRTKELMNSAVMDCCVVGYEHLIPSVSLPDPDDRHVLAAAIHARVDGIVTFNLKDYPRSVLGPLNLEAIHPDDFLTFQLDMNEAAVVEAASACCRRLKHPPKTGQEYLDTLLAQSVPKTVGALRPYEKFISAN